MIPGVHYEPLELHIDQASRQNKINNPDKNSETDWLQDLAIEEKCSTYLEKFIRMLTYFECTKDFHIGSIKAMENQVELKKIYRPPALYIWHSLVEAERHKR